MYNKNKKLNIKPLCIPLYKKQKKNNKKKSIDQDTEENLHIVENIDPGIYSQTILLIFSSLLILIQDICLTKLYVFVLIAIVFFLFYTEIFL